MKKAGAALMLLLCASCGIPQQAATIQMDTDEGAVPQSEEIEYPEESRVSFRDVVLPYCEDSEETCVSEESVQ